MNAASSPGSTPIFREPSELRKIKTIERKAGPAQVFIPLAFAAYAILICEWLHIMVT